METEILISTLVGDLRPVHRRSTAAFLAAALMAGAAFSLVLVLAWLRARPDLGEALLGFTFWMKASYTGWIALIGWQLLGKASVPDAPDSTMLRHLVPPIVALTAIGLAQWIYLPRASTGAFWLGSSWLECPVRIVALSVPVLAGALVALRRYAPARPAEAGTIAGLLAGATAATVYGLHCAELSAGFVLVWYSLGIAAVAVAGGWAGARLLRW